MPKRAAKVHKGETKRRMAKSSREQGKGRRRSRRDASYYYRSNQSTDVKGIRPSKRGNLQHRLTKSISELMKGRV
jgi:hypothetical protein